MMLSVWVATREEKLTDRKDNGKVRVILSKLAEEHII
jgi:hypothetical protein